MLSKANQGLATLEKYRARLDQVSARLTALEFEGEVVLYDALAVLQRAEMVTRMAAEVERYIIELGTEGRLIEMQLEETVVGVMADRVALVRDYSDEDTEQRVERDPPRARRARRTRTCSTSAASPSCSATTARPTPLDFPVAPARLPRALARSRGCRGWWRRASFSALRRPRGDPRRDRRGAAARSRAWGRRAPRTSARACAGFRRSTSSTVTLNRRPHRAAVSPGREQAIPELAVEEEAIDLDVDDSSPSSAPSRRATTSSIRTTGPEWS